MNSYELTFYDQLLKFQLFQGLSRTELLQMTGSTKFGFTKLAPAKTLLRDGDECRQLFFLVGGSIRLTTQSDDRAYAVTEQLNAPWLLQPETLFGAQPRYTCTVVTATEAHFISLSKDEVLRLLDEFFIFRLNLLNLLATQSQRSSRRPWRRASASLRERVVRFMLDHSVYPAGHKEIRILMTRLALEVGDSRLDVSRVLNQMQAESLVELHRGRIVVPSLERLFM